VTPFWRFFPKRNLSMQAAVRSWLILGGVFAAILLAFGWIAYEVIMYRVVAKYDSCVLGLSEQQRRTPGLALIVDQLRRLERFHTTWNLNAPFRRDAVNILIPNEASADWHAACGLPVAPADCLAAARPRFIVCNAIVGRQLSNPLLVSGIAREEIEQARRFLALVVLGHEIGHLQAGQSYRVQHLFPTHRANGLLCRRRDAQEPSEEERADTFGIALACGSVRAAVTEPAARDVRSAVGTISAFRNTLDEELFAFDDSCAGDDAYPSMSRRKSTFALAYARCLYPNADLPYPSVANDQDIAFRHLEEWLKPWQVTGFVASSEYGASPLYRFDVAATFAQNRFATFDSSGKSSRVSVTTVDGVAVRHQVLAAWDRAGTLIGSHAGAPSRSEFLVSIGADDGDTVRHVILHCGQPERPCEAKATVACE
jgi:hypothetical protein